MGNWDFTVENTISVDGYFGWTDYKMDFGFFRYYLDAI